MTPLELMEKWEARFISVKDVLGIIEKGEVKDPCIYCGCSTIFGSGRFVNRIPADRLCDETNATVDGYECAECGTPPICMECDIEPVEDVHSFRCPRCEEDAYAEYENDLTLTIKTKGTDNND
mgnify:CR=1 FL=1